MLNNCDASGGASIGQNFALHSFREKAVARNAGASLNFISRRSSLHFRNTSAEATLPSGGGTGPG
ncbi:hypothetical protein I7I50_10548 [Histoplasma capsulatum G186AR]|uniref:Uncharacterized protein n=1 Tax=Ajellomyces capsulatus TaxID=5037 RepID=A0A8H8D6R5_AJECA|nr:hypothetical protein I7I52_01787 [Histoplasma capsulatum]QSS69302.1 hypothetical protein I7I50_10548 [Histoplasma capsulatum G186AR]